jgi:hypothetical protein
MVGLSRVDDGLGLGTATSVWGEMRCRAGQRKVLELVFDWDDGVRRGTVG